MWMWCVGGAKGGGVYEPGEPCGCRQGWRVSLAVLRFAPVFCPIQKCMGTVCGRCSYPHELWYPFPTTTLSWS